MIFLVCSCGLALRTSGDPNELSYLIGPESSWYPSQYPCPHSDCDKCMQFVEAIDSASIPELEIHDLTLHEAFAALHGLGLPKERDCGEAALRELHGRKISHISSQQIRGSNRSVVYFLTLDDGTKLFLGSGAEGAVAYRIARPRNYMAEVLDGLKT